MTIAELKEKNITELTRIARSLELPGASGLRITGRRDFSLVPSGQPGLGRSTCGGTNPDAETNRRKDNVLATDGGSKGS